MDSPVPAQAPSVRQTPTIFDILTSIRFILVDARTSGVVENVELLRPLEVEAERLRRNTRRLTLRARNTNRTLSNTELASPREPRDISPPVEPVPAWGYGSLESDSERTASDRDSDDDSERDITRMQRARDVDWGSPTDGPAFYDRLLAVTSRSSRLSARLSGSRQWSRSSAPSPSAPGTQQGENVPLREWNELPRDLPPISLTPNPGNTSWMDYEEDQEIGEPPSWILNYQHGDINVETQQSTAELTGVSSNNRAENNLGQTTSSSVGAVAGSEPRSAGINTDNGVLQVTATPLNELSAMTPDERETGHNVMMREELMRLLREDTERYDERRDAELGRGNGSYGSHELVNIDWDHDSALPNPPPVIMPTSDTSSVASARLSIEGILPVEEVGSLTLEALGNISSDSDSSSRSITDQPQFEVGGENPQIGALPTDIPTVDCHIEAFLVYLVENCAKHMWIAGSPVFMSRALGAERSRFRYTLLSDAWIEHTIGADIDDEDCFHTTMNEFQRNYGEYDWKVQMTRSALSDGMDLRQATKFLNAWLQFWTDERRYPFHCPEDIVPLSQVLFWVGLRQGWGYWSPSQSLIERVSSDFETRTRIRQYFPGYFPDAWFDSNSHDPEQLAAAQAFVARELERLPIAESEVLFEVASRIPNAVEVKFYVECWLTARSTLEPPESLRGRPVTVEETREWYLKTVAGTILITHAVRECIPSQQRGEREV